MHNISIGFSFTDEPIKHLNRNGFCLHQNILPHDRSYLSYSAFFENQSAFEIREIIEVEKYAECTSIKHFEPFQMQLEVDCAFQEHPNTVVLLKEVLTSSTIIELDSLREFFKIRKHSSLWALWLECKDFSIFTGVAKPDRIFSLNGNKIALIHLGPNCFDLLVSQK